MGQYQNEHTKAWAAKIAEFDGFVFVTPEYNHSTSRRAEERDRLPVRRVEQQGRRLRLLRRRSAAPAPSSTCALIAVELQIAHVRQQVAFSLFTDFENFSVFKPAAQHDAAADALFDQLESWAGALRTVRG